jgi:hypothetical protein
MGLTNKGEGIKGEVDPSNSGKGKLIDLEVTVDKISEPYVGAILFTRIARSTRSSKRQSRCDLGLVPTC